MKEKLKERIKSDDGITLIAIILIAAIIIFVIVVLSMAFSKKPSVKNEIATNNVKTESNTEEDYSNKYWYIQYLNKKQKEEYDFSLADKKFSTPVDLFSADDFAENYTCYPDGSSSEMFETTTISDILNSDVLIEDDCSVWIEYGEKDDEYDTYLGKINISINNYSDEKLSIKECYENDWWEIKECSLGITVPKDNSSLNSKPYLDEIVEELGAPKHIYNLMGNDNSESKSYLLDYQYDEFDIFITVNDMPQYDSVKSGYIFYSPSANTKYVLDHYENEFDEFEVIK